MSVSRKLREIACACSGEGGRDWPHDNLIALAQELETIATLMANKVAFADDVDDDELTEWASRLSHLQPQPPYEEPDVDHDVSLDDLRDIADGKTQHDDD